MSNAEPATTPPTSTASWDTSKALTGPRRLEPAEYTALPIGGEMHGKADEPREAVTRPKYAGT